MTRGASHFRQADLTRAIKGLQAAGVKIERVEVGVDGSLVLHVEQNGKKKAVRNPWDQVLSNDDAQP